MTAALEGGEWSAARPGRTLPRERPGTHFTGGWVGRRAGPHRDSIPDRPARSQSFYRLSYRAHKIFIILFYLKNQSLSNTEWSYTSTPPTCLHGVEEEDFFFSYETAN